MKALKGAAPQKDVVVFAASSLDPSAETTVEQRTLLKRNLLDVHLGPFLTRLGFDSPSAYDRIDTASDLATPSLISALRGQTGDTFWSIVPLSVAV